MNAIEQARFWDKVRKEPNGCWLWIGSQFASGYGSFYAEKRNQLAHRVSFLLSGGILTEERPNVIHGPCHNRLCVNPKHLSAGSTLENVLDKQRDNMVALGDRNGSRLHPERLPRGARHHSHLRPETVVKGEQQGRAKLSEAQVKSIRVRYAKGTILQKDLAIEFGVANQLISRIVNNKSWTHL